MVDSFVRRDGIDYVANFYRCKLYSKSPNNYLLTTDDGNFVFLNSFALRQFRMGKILDEKFFKLLELKGFVVSSNNFNAVVDKIKLRYSFLENGTSLHIVIPTHRCNLDCVYCFASSKCIDASREESDMSEESARRIVEFIMRSPSHAITIEFQGGEPTARFDIVELMVMYAKELNVKYKKDLRFAMVTNLTLMTDYKANWLIDNGVTICTSFDGPKEVHDKNRFILSKKGEEVGTYSLVVYWIRRINAFYAKKKILRRVNALMTITSYSLPYYKEIIDEYLRLGVVFLNIRPMTFLGRATMSSAFNISYTRIAFVDFFEKSILYIDELKKRGVPVVERIVELYEKKVLENRPQYHTEYESPCGAATGQIIYFTDGKIYTCNEALGKDEFCLGDVFEDSWQDVFKKKETSKAILNSMLESNVMCDRCAYKPYCSTCMVENYSRDSKFNFYPTNTSKHFETIYHCNRIFDELLKGKIDVKK